MWCYLKREASLDYWGKIYDSRILQNRQCIVSYRMYRIASMLYVGIIAENENYITIGIELPIQWTGLGSSHIRTKLLFAAKLKMDAS